MRNRKFILRKYLVIVFLIGCLYAKKGNSQIMPSEGSKLNYTLTGFSVKSIPEVKEYEFCIAIGNYTSIKEFNKNVIITKKEPGSKTMIQLPSFGKSYTWQVKCNNSRKESVSKLYHFSTDTSSFVDKKKFRLRILNNNYKDSNLLFFMDYARVLVNMKGEPVWFLPDIDSVLDRSELPRDFKFTSDGTITFLTDFGAYEVDYQGRLLWKAGAGRRGAGRGNKQEGNTAYRYYHHELYKMKNGHYLTLKDKEIQKKIPDSAISEVESFIKLDKIGDHYFMTIISASAVELDADGKVVWESDLSDQINVADVIPLLKLGIKKSPDMHANAFYFNEKDSLIYIGFKNTSQIYKITYPGSKLLKCYDGAAPGMPKLFSNQHSIVPTYDSSLCIFNNNLDGKRDDSVVSSIIVLDEPENQSNKLIKHWEFPCNIDTFASPVTVRGGNAAQLNDGSFMVCMGTSNRVFIVDKQKNVLFNALSEFWFDDQKMWTAFGLYRATPVSREFLKAAILLTIDE